MQSCEIKDLQDRDKNTNSKVSNDYNLHTLDDLISMQNRDFYDKIQTSVAKILEVLNRYNKKCYVSFSGGKDSTVLADLVAQCCKLFNCKLTL